MLSRNVCLERFALSDLSVVEWSDMVYFVSFQPDIRRNYFRLYSGKKQKMCRTARRDGDKGELGFGRRAVS